MLVSNAGVAGLTCLVVDCLVEAWRKVLEAHLIDVLDGARAVLPHVVARGYGRIVTVVSVAGKGLNPNMPVYSASKAGVTPSLGRLPVR